MQIKLGVIIVSSRTRTEVISGRGKNKSESESTRLRDNCRYTTKVAKKNVQRVVIFDNQAAENLRRNRLCIGKLSNTVSSNPSSINTSASFR